MFRGCNTARVLKVVRHRNCICMFERSNLSSILCCTVKSQESFYTIVELPEGEHQYKFLVDGSWRHSDHTPTVDNKMGSLNNLVVVHATDFEVCCSAPLPHCPSLAALPCRTTCTSLFRSRFLRITSIYTSDLDYYSFTVHNSTTLQSALLNWLLVSLQVFRALAADMGAGVPTTGPTPPASANLAPSETKHTSRALITPLQSTSVAALL